MSIVFYASYSSFLAGMVLGYFAASQRASEREHSVKFGRSLDLDPCQRARNWEGQ